MLALFLVLLLVLVLGGAGFVIHVLWWVALAVLVLWLLGFVFAARGSGSRARWYRW
ncbi:hydrophobic protein [Kitasatospora sp. NPDC001132]